MMEHNSTGRCVLNTSRRLRVLLCCALSVTAVTAPAAPVDQFDQALSAALQTAEGAWSDSLLQIERAVSERESAPYDEQVFTELSPILDSPDAIKLPQDQQLLD